MIRCWTNRFISIVWWQQDCTNSYWYEFFIWKTRWKSFQHVSPFIFNHLHWIISYIIIIWFKRTLAHIEETLEEKLLDHTTKGLYRWVVVIGSRSLIYDEESTENILKLYLLNQLFYEYNVHAYISDYGDKAGHIK